MLSLSQLHYALIDHIIRKGYAPETPELAENLGVSQIEVEQRLKDLQEYHGVVLHPNEPKVWAIHPFSLAPTPFSVQGARHTWWGNCAWCSLGVAAIVQEDVLIKSTSGALGEPVEVRVKRGEMPRCRLADPFSHTHDPSLGQRGLYLQYHAPLPVRGGNR